MIKKKREGKRKEKREIWLKNKLHLLHWDATASAKKSCKIFVNSTLDGGLVLIFGMLK